MSGIETYRVEKDGRSFYVQEEMLQYYQDNGYRIFKSYEREIDANGEPVNNGEE